jgi:hypothetical protein
MATQPVKDQIPRYVAAWNDPDPVHQRSELASLYAEDGRIVTRRGRSRRA